LATRFPWRIATLSSLLAFAVVTTLMQNIFISLLPLFALVVLTMLIGMRSMPKQTQGELVEAKPGPWDIPVRILLGTGFILLLTETASFLGPRLTGLLATLPIYTLILTVFAHRLQGSMGAINVLRGLLFGMFGFVSFFFILGMLIERTRFGTAFLAAILTALFVQGNTLRILPPRTR
jgi:hypothetical protein